MRTEKSMQVCKLALVALCFAGGASARTLRTCIKVIELMPLERDVRCTIEIHAFVAFRIPVSAAVTSADYISLL